MSRRLPMMVCLALSWVGSSSHAAHADAAHADAPPAGYSAPALYNLANAYARTGKPGLAVLNYERARLLEPGDPDVVANLRHVRETSGLPQPPQSAFDRIAGTLSPRLLAWLGVLGLSLAGLSALARVGRKSHRRKLLLAMLVGFSLLGVSIANGVALWPIMHQAVVVTPSAPVRVSPVTTEEPLFVLPEAAIVAMRAEHEGFILVQTRAGRSGWVPGADLAPIVPRR